MIKTNIYKVLIGFLLIGVFSTNCKKNDSTDGSTDCQSRTGNSMEAKIDGTHVCTDLGTALLTDVDGSRLSVVGFLSKAEPPSSITLDIDNPGVGTFDLTEAQYSIDDEVTTTYFVVNKEFDEGSGSITITELTDTYVTGTFEFTAIGINGSNDNPTGEEVVVTNGTFYFVLGSNFF